MKKVIAAMNMTLDGFCDHTYGVPDEEIHQHYADLLRSAGTALYGRITYQLMEFWRTVLENPTGDKAMDDFNYWRESKKCRNLHLNSRKGFGCKAGGLCRYRSGKVAACPS